MSTGWQGGSTTAWRKLRAFVLARDLYQCQVQLPGTWTTAAGKVQQCEGKANEVHHLDGVKGGLICPPSRLQAACRSCNNRLGDPTQPDSSVRFFPGQEAHTSRPLSIFSPPAAAAEPVEAREGLAWDPVALAAYAWLEPFLDVPEDARPPLYMTPVPDDAVGSYGADAIEWIEDSQTDKSGRPLKLRWWQKLGIVRQLEHRADGSLCHRNVLESCPRRAGKSVRMRTLAVWRMAHPDLFGEVQTIVHTGSDVQVCEEIQRDAWRWAEGVAGWKVVRANGRRSVETPDGDRWVVKAQDAAGYSFDVSMGIVDEAWDVKPGTVDEGLEPASMERLSPQIYITSTAHRRATSLMRTRLQVAITTELEDTLLLLWAAPADADPGDPETWRAASPYWSEDRRKMIAGKYAKALSGEADPQADDPNPMEGFRSQYLNVWQLNPVAAERGNPVIEAEEWAALTADNRHSADMPYAAAIESWFDGGVSLALGWKVGDEVVVSVEDMADLAAAAEALKASGFRRTATVGASLLEDPALKGVRSRKGQGRVGSTVQELDRLLAEDAFRHDGGEHLTGQVLSARTMPGADGPRMASTGRADAIKAAVWAVQDCRRKSAGRPMIITAAG